MQRKLRELFEAGVDVDWEVDPKKRTVAVYERGKRKPRLYNQSQSIECGLKLVGFRLVLAELFSELDRVGKRLNNG
jgi:hypothetical protein